MKKISIVTLTILASLSCFSQSLDTITLSQLHKALERNHPIASIKQALDSSANLQVKNINAIWFPKLDANATATWQSDVIEFKLPFPGITIPSPDPDQYKLTLDATQVIWDGGATRVRRDLTLAQSNAEKLMIENEIYLLRDRVNETFFAIILLDINKNQLALMKEELGSKIESLKSGVKEGIALQSSVQTLQAEMLRLEQKLIEISSRKASLRNTLETLTGISIEENVKISSPTLSMDKGINLVRPELEGFNLQKKVFDSRALLASKRRMPTLGGFVTAGYGKPGLNMLSSEWDTYVVAGAKLSWNIWDWNVTSREKQQLIIQRSTIDYRKNAFEDAVNNQIAICLNDIETINQQIIKDEEIVSLLEAVKNKSASQLANGTISSSEFLTDFNSASRAKLDMEYRKVLLDKEKVKLMFLMGKEIIE